MRIELEKEGKKAAIVSLGARISLDSNNVRSVDLKYMRIYLEKVYGRSVDFVSKLTSKDRGHRSYFKNIVDVDLNDYDEVWIYNFPIHTIGGEYDITAIYTFEKLCDFRGRVYYFMIDPKLPCKNYGENLKYKMSLHGGKINTTAGWYSVDSGKIEKYIEDIWPRIVIAFDGLDYDRYKEVYHKIFDKRIAKENKTSHILKINFEADWCQLLLAEFYSVNEKLDMKLKSYDFSDKKYDLVYFGNKRQDPKRNRVLKSLYDDEDFEVLCIGFDPEFKKSKYSVLDYVEHDRLFPLIGKSLVSIVICDELHSGNIKSVRYFESMLLDSVALIHSIFDPDRLYIKNKELADFVYIDTVEDVKDRVRRLREDRGLYDRIIELERKEIMDEYSKYIVDGIEEEREQLKILDFV